MDAEQVIQVIIMGIVQGIAEFLPISSSGHLVIVDALLSGKTAALEDNMALNIALHLGTLGSILVVYRRDLVRYLFDLPMLLAIVVATLPVVVVGLTLKDAIEQAFNTPLVAACGLLVTAVLLWLCEGLEPAQSDAATIETVGPTAPDFRQAFSIGLFQSLALVPGISRSGSTIAGAVMVGLSREQAARFSFLIAIPAISGATLLHGIDMLREPAQASLSPLLLVGAVVSFAVGIVALEGLLKLIQKRRLRWFSVYCVGVSLLTMLWIFSQQ